jgi:hypothetical protein
MRTLKISKYHIYQTMKSVKGFYTIFISVIIFLYIISSYQGGSVSSSGLEISTIIFLFIAGLNSFKSNFKFSQANNVSRKTFFKGLFIGILPITISMSIIDLIVNRTYNIFVKCPTIYDMVYGSYRMATYNIDNWVQSNGIATLAATFTWQFAFYTMVFWAGILVSLIYYRSNTLMKVIVSIIPVFLLSFSNTIVNLLNPFIDEIGEFIITAFGLQSQNSYMAVLSFLVIALILAGFVYLLTRKAIVKE